MVRIRGIRRKGTEAESGKATAQAAKFLVGPEGAGLWELLLQAGMLDYASDAAIGAQEPAFVAKYAFQLAQAFNNFYHKHHILSEQDVEKRAFLLGLTEIVERQLVKALSLLGIEAPHANRDSKKTEKGTACRAPRGKDRGDGSRRVQKDWTR